MASTKDIYEAHVWRANIFAAGVWRGTGVAIATYGYLQLRNTKGITADIDAILVASDIDSAKALTPDISGAKVQNG